MSLDRCLLYPSRFVSQAGQGLFFAALVMLGGGTATPAAGISAVLIAMVVASLLLGVPGGMVVDRVGPGRALMLGSLLRLVAVGMAWFAGGDASALIAAAFAYSAASQLFSPAEMALVRSVRRTQSGTVHSVLIALQYGGQGFGVLLAPVLYLLGGTDSMLLASASAYLAVAMIGAVIAEAVRVAPDPERHRRDIAWQAAARYFREEPQGTYAASLLTFGDVATKCLLVSLPFYLREQLDLSALQLAVLVALGGAGAATGLVWGARSFGMHIADRAMRLTLAATIASVAVLAGLGSAIVMLADYSQLPFAAETVGVLNPGFVVALPVAVILGLCSTVARVGARAVLSETAPLRVQGTVFAAQRVATDTLVLVPLIVVASLNDIAGARPALALIAAIGLGVFAALEWWLPRRFARRAEPLEVAV